MSTAAVDVDSSALPPMGSPYMKLHVDGGEASWLVTLDGTSFRKCTLGIGLTTAVHTYPRVVAAVQARGA